MVIKKQLLVCVCIVLFTVRGLGDGAIFHSEIDAVGTIQPDSDDELKWIRWAIDDFDFLQDEIMIAPLKSASDVFRDEAEMWVAVYEYEGNLRWYRHKMLAWKDGIVTMVKLTCNPASATVEIKKSRDPENRGFRSVTNLVSGIDTRIDISMAGRVSHLEFDLVVVKTNDNTIDAWLVLNSMPVSEEDEPVADSYRELSELVSTVWRLNERQLKPVKKQPNKPVQEPPAKAAAPDL